MVVYQQGNRRRRSILFLIVITAVALITLDLRGSGPLSSLTKAARDVVSPINGVVETVFSPVGDWVDGVVHSGSLKDENAQLRRRLDEERGKLASAEAAIEQNKELLKILDLPFVEDSDAIAARVVGGAPGNFDFTVQVDAGSHLGVEPEMAVVTGAGLVGKVSLTSRDRATVDLLRDPKSGVGVRLQNSAATGIVNGTGDGSMLRLHFVDPSVKVTKGEQVFTSGEESSAFPAGIPVGTVAKVKRQSGELEQDILVTPIVDFGRLDYVKVLQPLQRSGGAP